MGKDLILLRSSLELEPAWRELHRRRVRRATAESLLEKLQAALGEQLGAILVPAAKIDYSQLTAIRMSLRQRLQDAVGRTMGQTTIVRDLVPADVTGIASGSNNYARLANINALVANTMFNKDISRQIPNNTAVGIYGYEQLSPVPLIDVIQLALQSGVVLAQFHLDAIYTDQQQSIGYFDPPVVFSPLQGFQANLLAGAAVSAAAEAYGLLGFTAEPAGQTVAPDQTNLV